MNTFATFEKTPYDDLERQHDDADLPFEDTAPPSFKIAPAQPDIAALREAARDIMEQSAISKKRDEAALSYVELSTDDLREILGVGDLVAYTYPGYPFEGKVTELDPETDRARVRFDGDQFGVRYFWCALDLLQLLLKAAARDAQQGVG